MCAKVRSTGISQSSNRTSQRNAHQSSKAPLTWKSRVDRNRTGGRTPFRKSSRILLQRPSTGRHISRKKNERNNCVNLQNTQKLTIPHVPFQRDAGTSQSNKAIYSDDDSDLDYLGRLPPPTKDYEQSESSGETSSDGNDNSSETSYQQTTKKPNNNCKKSEKLAEISEHRNDVTKKSMAIPRLAFENLIHEIMEKQGNNFLMESTTIECLQEASEQVLIQFFEDINSVPKSPQTLIEARMKFMIMDFYMNLFQNDK